jgi:hypothetical protein
MPVVSRRGEAQSATLKVEHIYYDSASLRTGCCVEYWTPNREEVTDSWIKLHNKGLDDLYCSQNIIGMMRSVRTIKAGHVVCMRKIKNA